MKILGKVAEVHGWMDGARQGRQGKARQGMINKHMI